MIKVSCRMAGNSRNRICNGDKVPPNTACSHDKTSRFSLTFWPRLTVNQVSQSALLASMYKPPRSLPVGGG